MKPGLLVCSSAIHSSCFLPIFSHNFVALSFKRFVTQCVGLGSIGIFAFRCSRRLTDAKTRECTTSWLAHITLLLEEPMCWPAWPCENYLNSVLRISSALRGAPDAGSVTLCRLLRSSFCGARRHECSSRGCPSSVVM